MESNPDVNKRILRPCVDITDINVCVFSACFLLSMFLCHISARRGSGSALEVVANFWGPGAGGLNPRVFSQTWRCLRSLNAFCYLCVDVIFQSGMIRVQH